MLDTTSFYRPYPSRYFLPEVWTTGGWVPYCCCDFLYKPKGREGSDRMEVIGSEQRQEDPSFFELHWEEETARRWERREVGTTRQEELKIRLRLSSLSQRGLSTDERRRTATPMRNILTFKLEDGGVGGGNRSTGFDISTD